MGSLRTVGIRLVLLFAFLLSAGNAHAEPWYRGKYGRNRVTHLVISGVAGVSYLASVTFLAEPLSPDACRWCTPPSFDRSARNALVWDDTGRANLLSNLSGYLAEPVVGITLLILSEKEHSTAQIMDDVLPVLETVALSQVLTNIVKFSVGRARPFVHFGTSTEKGVENNLSFWSGHSALAFGVTTSAGLVAHWRGYATEPYIWGAGFALSLTTQYLRIAADRHYLSDVIVGGLIGVGSGLLIPRLMRRDLAIVPTPHGAAISGAF